MKFDEGFVVDLLACYNIALVVLVLPFCKIKVSYHTYLIFSPQMMAFFMYVDFVKLNVSDEVQRQDEMLF